MKRKKEEKEKKERRRGRDRQKDKKKEDEKYHHKNDKFTANRIGNTVTLLQLQNDKLTN